ncbi:MAG TPA: hypothetical protein VFZ09_14515 [Archangium sp.]|uniref:P-loop ATPase, Sll1717 family n=1 Tax=Archangium sp. TaxID=1872627 RepID=UPI002E366625|nr:hypothetical protein [Archangium sp.]HEX5747455.1 hypothetical protein [Archangium sp.]
MSKVRPTGFPTASISELRKILSEGMQPSRMRIRRTFDGTIDLRILADVLDGVDDPESHVREVLAEAGFELPERTLMFLKAPADIEPEEANLVFSPEPVGTPTWGDALLREPEEEVVDDRGFECKVVAFWGLKGGVGRSTALAHVSSLLGRRMKVLALDLDLDSPGLVATLSDDLSPDGRPRFEKLVKAAGDGDESSDEKLEEMIAQALRRGKDVNSRVDVLGPLLADAEFVQALLGPLAPASLYRGGQPALRRLLRVAIRASEAEIVLVDTRSGYCDESAMTVLDLADEVAFFASPAPSTFMSMEPAIYALERNRRALGRPKLVHVVAGMMPAGEDARRRIHDELRVVMEHSRAGVNEDLETAADGELPPDIEILPIDYASRIVENEGRLIPGAVEGYRELAERLVPVDVSAPILAPEPGWVREVLREADIPVAQAENEENFEKLADLFTSTRDLHDFVRHEVCLVLGAKGTGKSYLRRMCLEHKDTLTRRSGTKALENTIFVDGYSQLTPGSTSMPPITRDVLRELDRIKGRDWSHMWSALALGRAIARMRSSGMEIEILRESKRKVSLERLVESTSAQSVRDAVKKLVQEPLVLDEMWESIDRTCSRAGKTLTLLFDDLDVALGESMRDIRRRSDMIEGLLDRTNVSWVSRRHLAAKVFLREDIFRSLNVEEEAKYATRRVVLNWAPEEIWRLVVRAMAVASPRFTKRLAGMGIDRERLEECTEQQRLGALALIWGNRMGEGESNTRSTAWVWGRLHDGANRMFPRAALWLLRFALEQRRKRSLDDKLPLLDPPALRAAIPLVATERLAELKKECAPDERRRIDLLRGFDSYQDEVKFLRALKGAGESDPGEALKSFKTLGIVEAGSRRNGTPTVRIVDLYAFAPELEINRLGRR